jgi:hypothetical protein
MMLGALTMSHKCPYCGKPMSRFDYELCGGCRECLLKREEEENGNEGSLVSEDKSNEDNL